MPIEIVALLTLGAMSIFVHLGISQMNKNKLSSLDSIVKKLEEVKEEKGLNISIETSSKAKPSYDYVDRKISLREGNSLNHVAEAFHELGHAIDHQNAKDKPYRWYHGLLFYLMKYSIPLSVVLYLLEKGLYGTSNFLLGLTSLSMILGLFFAVMTLKEEVVATKNAIQVMKEKNIVQKNEWNAINFSLVNGMQSYIVIAVFTILLVAFQIFYLISLI